MLGHSGLLSRRVSQCLQLFASASTLKLNCCACCLVLRGAAFACWSCRRHWQQLRLLFGSSQCFGWFHSLLCGGRHPHTPYSTLCTSTPSLPVDASRVCFVFLVAAFVFITFFAIVVGALAQLILSHSLSLSIYLSLSLVHPFLLFLHLFMRC